MGAEAAVSEGLAMSAEAAVAAALPRPLAQQARRYLAALLAEFAQPAQPAAAPYPRVGASPALAERVMDILGERRFTHLSRTQAVPYRALMRPLLQADLDAGRPLRFGYDLGPGYHASLRTDGTGLRFAPGLGELLALRQIRRFAQAVEAVYGPGVRFTLVIDDLCAWLANGVAPARTAAYLARLEALIRAVEMQDRVAVLAESALLSAGDYQRAFASEPARAWTQVVGPAERDNVSRFVGRECADEEVREHLARHQRALAVSERVLAKHVSGVRLTQRATPTCLGFRSFPGGDARLQSGEVDLLLAEGAEPRPALITSRNLAQYQRCALGADGLPPDWPLPPGVVHVALRRPAGASGP